METNKDEDPPTVERNVDTTKPPTGDDTLPEIQGEEKKEHAAVHKKKKKKQATESLNEPSLV